MTRQRVAVPRAALDACCLFDLLASGNIEAILRASGFSWQLPSAVQDEVKYVRRPDPAQPGKLMKVAVDLSGYIKAGVLKVCDPQNQRELDRFMHYATLFRSDGESMCLALAEERGWVVATDDRRAIRIAQQAGLTVVSSPQLLRAWANAAAPSQATLQQVLQDIELLAQFKPNPTMPEYQWWVDQLANANP
jgi:predicted nucleic acid-binding protein